MIDCTIGMIGGGQLGRMSVEAANSLNIKVLILDKQPNPAGQVTSIPGHIDAEYKLSPDGILALAAACDVITMEIEHINCEALDQAKVAFPKLEIHPSADTIRLIQDKYAQKVDLLARGIPVAPFCVVANTIEAIEAVGIEYGYPFLLKARRLAYDGRGNYVVKSKGDIPTGYAALGSGELDLYAEKFVPFIRELAVMVVCGRGGEVQTYPVVETVQQDNICKVVIAPAQISSSIATRAQAIAKDVVAGLKGAGVYGVELFLLADGQVLVNEIAPRTHNSGHYTIEACYTSQFENHIRAVSGLPIGCCDLKVGASVMVNVLGKDTMQETLAPCVKALTMDGATIHMYGKSENRAGRKMGHITICRATMEEARVAANILLDSSGDQRVAISDADARPLVGVIMGSDSDLGYLSILIVRVMKPAAQILKDFGIPFELTIVSAHRTPDRMMEYAKSARVRGLKVIIAAAGGAAHLPGMVAALTPLPVIGVPVALKFLDGVDSLHSIVQMPRGVPVATVAISNSANAALLALRILGTSFDGIWDKLVAYKEEQEAIVMGKVEDMKVKGWEGY